jgi:hypothetical protein
MMQADISKNYDLIPVKRREGGRIPSKESMLGKPGARRERQNRQRFSPDEQAFE